MDLTVTVWAAAPDIRLWLARTGEVEEGAWSVLYGQMDPRRQARCDRFRREEDRRRCILADALARRALCEGTDRAPEDIVFAYGPRGKPWAPGLERHFSLSHSGALVLCATAPFPLGADIQRQRRVSESVTRRLARAGYRGETEEEFFAWWVRQEAAGKLTGAGLSLTPPPANLAYWPGTLAEPDGRYFYCVCAEKIFQGEKLALEYGEKT